MAVFLTILKIIGIVLASVIGLVLLVLSLILFVPIRYKVKAKKENCDETVIEAHGTITWLLHILNIHIDYPSDSLIKIRIFFFNINKKDKTPKKEKKVKEKKIKDKKPKGEKNRPTGDEENAELLDDNDHKTDTEDSRISDVTQTDEIETTSDNEDNADCDDLSANDSSNSGKEDIIDDDESNKKTSLKDFLTKIADIVKNIKLTVKRVYDKIVYVCKNINKYVGIITSNTFSHAFKKCRVSLMKILKKIMPRKLSGNVYFGTGDPSSTGKALGAFSLIYPYVSPKLNVYPDFENKMAYGDIYIKGHFCIFTIVRLLACTYFNKDVKKLLKMLKKEA